MAITMLERDLVYQVRTLLQEANRGDEPARAWLVQSFPAHVDFFLAAWDEERPAPPKQRQSKRVGASEL